MDTQTELGQRASHPSLTRRRILVVEDEYFLADDIVRALQEAGAIVVGPAASTEGALAMLETGPPIDCAVLDINLRGKMSFGIADWLRERDIPFVFETGYDVSAVPPEYRNVPRWEKPFDTQMLVQALSSPISGRR